MEQLGSQRHEIFHCLKNYIGFDPEINTVNYYNKKINNKEITLKDLPDILDRKNEQELCGLWE